MANQQLSNGQHRLIYNTPRHSILPSLPKTLKIILPPPPSFLTQSDQERGAKAIRAKKCYLFCVSTPQRKSRTQQPTVGIFHTKNLILMLPHIFKMCSKSLDNILLKMKNEKFISKNIQIYSTTTCNVEVAAINDNMILVNHNLLNRLLDFYQHVISDKRPSNIHI